MFSVLVTGATSGLGLETAHVLAEQGHRVVALARDEERADRVVRDLRRAHAEAPEPSWVRCDLSSVGSVVSAAQEIVDRGDVPQRLVFNAGVQVVSGLPRSADGHELTMATNVLGHVVLFRELLPALRSGARVVTVSSETHRGGLRAFGFPAARWEDPAALFDPPPGSPETSQAGRVRYATSKLAAIHVAREIDRRYGHAGIHATAFDPGLMPATGLARDYPPLVRRVYRAVAPLVERLPGAASTRASAENLAHLATTPHLDDLWGAYVSGRQARRSSPASYDRAAATALWEHCERLAPPPGVS